MNNDWVMFRYSEVIYNKAEALMRKNGGKATQEVVDMINSVRQRSFKQRIGRKRNIRPLH